MNRPRILLTGMGAPGTPGTVACLRVEPVHIQGADASDNPPNTALADAGTVRLPHASSPDYVERLIAAADWCDAILPQTTAEVEVLARHKALIESESGARVCTAPYEAVQRSNSNHDVMSAAAEIGLPAPRWTRVCDGSGLADAAAKFGERPFVVKPDRGNGSRGVRIVNRQGARRRYFTEKPGADCSWPELRDTLGPGACPPLIVMDYLPGREYTVDCFRGRDGITHVRPRLRVAMRGGISTHTRLEMRADLIDYSQRLAEALGLSGAFGFQFIEGQDGTPRVIECNPRIQGTSVASMYAGLNLPLCAVRDALGLPVTITEPPASVEYRRVWSGSVQVSGRRMAA